VRRTAEATWPGRVLTVAGWLIGGGGAAVAGFALAAAAVDRSGAAWNHPDTAFPWVAAAGLWWLVGPASALVVLRLAGQPRGAQTGVALWCLAPLAVLPCLLLVVAERPAGVVPTIVSVATAWGVALPLVARSLAAWGRSWSSPSRPGPRVPDPSWPSPPTATGPPVDPTLPPVVIPSDHGRPGADRPGGDVGGPVRPG
jgi:hypothetical protein